MHFLETVYGTTVFYRPISICPHSGVCKYFPRLTGHSARVIVRGVFPVADIFTGGGGSNPNYGATPHGP